MTSKQYLGLLLIIVGLGGPIAVRVLFEMGVILK